MSWLLWGVVAYFVLGSLTTVGLIGKKREPVTPGVAVGVLLIHAALIAAVVFGGIVR